MCIAIYKRYVLHLVLCYMAVIFGVCWDYVIRISTYATCFMNIYIVIKYNNFLYYDIL